MTEQANSLISAVIAKGRWLLGGGCQDDEGAAPEPSQYRQTRLQLASDYFFLHGPALLDAVENMATMKQSLHASHTSALAAIEGERRAIERAEQAEAELARLRELYQVAREERTSLLESVTKVACQRDDLREQLVRLEAVLKPLRAATAGYLDYLQSSRPLDDDFTMVHGRVATIACNVVPRLAEPPEEQGERAGRKEKI